MSEKLDVLKGLREIENHIATAEVDELENLRGHLALLRGRVHTLIQAVALEHRRTAESR